MILRYLGPLSVDFGTVRIPVLFVSGRFYIFTCAVTLLLAVVGPYPEVHRLSFLSQLLFWPAVISVAILSYLAAIRLVGLTGVNSAPEPVLVAVLVIPLTIAAVYYAKLAVGLPIPPLSRFATLMAVNAVIIDALSHFFAYFVLSGIDNAGPQPSAAPPDLDPYARTETPSEPSHPSGAAVTGVFAWKSLSFSYRDLVRMDADRQYVTIHTRNRQFYVRGSFSEAVQLLPADLGIQIHRSHWVRVDHIRRLVRYRSKLFVELPCGAKLPVARAKVTELRRILTDAP